MKYVTTVGVSRFSQHRTIAIRWEIKEHSSPSQLPCNRHSLHLKRWNTQKSNRWPMRTIWWACLAWCDVRMWQLSSLRPNDLIHQHLLQYDLVFSMFISIFSRKKQFILFFWCYNQCQNCYFSLKLLSKVSFRCPTEPCCKSPLISTVQQMPKVCNEKENILWYCM